MKTHKNKARNNRGNYPTRYWWIPLVVVPILAALIVGIFNYLPHATDKEVVVISQPPTENNLGTTSNSFKLQMRKEGWFDLTGGERVYEFELLNTGDRIAITRDILLEVLSIAEGYPTIEATYVKSEYHILLKHDQVGDYLITDMERKYGKGDIEKFAVGVKSDKPGWQYMLRIKVVWYDPEEEEGERILYSDPYIAPL
jgi:hypothetical protein